jgi:hypothetical protein
MEEAEIAQQDSAVSKMWLNPVSKQSPEPGFHLFLSRRKVM